MTSTTDAATPADSAAAAEARPARAARPAKRRAEGQWALGYREPLNANEQAKKDDNPLNVRARIENIYSKQGFDSIDKGDLRAASAGGVSTPSAKKATTAPSPATRTSTCSRPSTS